MSNKSILVIDTPESCRACKLRYDNYGICEVCILADDRVDHFCETNTKPEWCSLSPIPERKCLRQYADNTALNMKSMLAYQYTQGWNDCIYKLMEEN